MKNDICSLKYSVIDCHYAKNLIINSKLIMKFRYCLLEKFRL